MSLRKNLAKRQTGKSKAFVLKCRLWIEGEEGTFAGFGRVVLPDRIRRHGYISKSIQ